MLVNIVVYPKEKLAQKSSLLLLFTRNLKVLVIIEHQVEKFDLFAEGPVPLVDSLINVFLDSVPSVSKISQIYKRKISARIADHFVLIARQKVNLLLDIINPKSLFIYPFNYFFLRGTIILLGIAFIDCDHGVSIVLLFSCWVNCSLKENGLIFIRNTNSWFLQNTLFLERSKQGKSFIAEVLSFARPKRNSYIWNRFGPLLIVLFFDQGEIKLNKALRFLNSISCKSPIH